MGVSVDTIHSFEEGMLISRVLQDKIYTLDELSIKKTESSSRQFFKHWFFVLEDGFPIGQLAVYDNPAIKVGSVESLVLGNFESINDPKISDLLFTAAQKSAGELNKIGLFGPMNGSTWETHRLAIESSPGLFFTEMVYPGYYPNLWKLAGFQPFETYISNIQFLDTENLIEAKPESKNRLESLQLEIRPLNMNKFESEMEGIFEFCLEVFKENPYYSPISKTDFLSKYLAMKPLIDPRFALQTFTKTGERVALFFCVPDLYDPSKTTLVIKTIARNPDPKYSGISHLVYEKMQRSALDCGYTRLIHAFMHQANRSNTISSLYSGKPFRTYNLYHKPTT